MTYTIVMASENFDNEAPTSSPAIFRYRAEKIVCAMSSKARLRTNPMTPTVVDLSDPLHANESAEVTTVNTDPVTQKKNADDWNFSKDSSPYSASYANAK